MGSSRPGNPSCRFLEVVERLPQCPCDCVPPIPEGPPCPFKPASGEPVANALRHLLQQTVTQDSNCPLKEKPALGPSADSDQLCVFSRPSPIDFKSLPRHTCTSIPGTCPELAKNFIRSLGFDPMCACSCRQAVKPSEPDTLEHKKKRKRRKKDKTKQTLAPSRSEIGAKSSSHEAPDDVPPNLSSTPAATENATPGVQSAVQSVPTGAPTEGLAPVKTTPKDPQFQKPKHSNNSGQSSEGSLLLEGKGFKIYEIDGENVLFNYSTKNCHLLNCKCSRKDDNSCGCSEWARLTKYCNCVCPGARKIKKAIPVPVLRIEGRT